jgi:hypothetical protein
MTKQYIVTLTDSEDLSLGYAAASQQDWIDNFVHERCRTAMDEIVTITVEKCIASGIQIPGTKDDIISLAFQKGWVISAKDKPIPALDQ